MPKPGADAGLKDEISLENSLPEKIDLVLLTKLPAAICRTDSLHNRIYDHRECTETILRFSRLFKNRIAAAARYLS